MTTQIRRAYSYVRFSTPEQLKGDSLRRQREASERYAADHNLILDDSLRLRDLGVSAFKGKNVSQGALAAFLEAVKQGKVASGSVLIVESLDRLSRAEMNDALTLFIGILNSNVNIVTLNPEREYSRKSTNDIVGILEPIMIMARAHEESAIKSMRIGKAWQSKRDSATDEKLTAHCPYWLELSADKKTFHLIPTAVEAIRLIFRLAMEGNGTTRITKILNKQGIKPIGRGKTWVRSYVGKILDNRAVIGEYQPYKGHGVGRQPIGEPIANYYPSIISEADFYKVQSVKTSRTNERGGGSADTVSNLFTWLVFDSHDNSPMSAINKGEGNGGRMLISSAAQNGIKGSRFITLNYNVFEAVILEWLHELKVSDFLENDSGNVASAKLSVAEGELAVVEGKIAKTKKALLADGNFDSLIDVLKTLEANKKTLALRVESLRTELHTPELDSLSDAKTVIDLLKSAEGEELTNLRLRLKAKIRSLVKSMAVTVTAESYFVRLVAVKIVLNSGITRTVGFTYNSRKANEWEHWGINDIADPLNRKAKTA